MSDGLLQRTYALFDTPKNQASIRELRITGQRVILFPVVETEAIDVEVLPADAIVAGFEWIIFTDIFAVDRFFAAIEKQGLEFFDLDQIRICAMGEAVADRLGVFQVHADVIPERTDADSVIRSIELYSGMELADMRLLLITSAGSEVAEYLTNKCSSIESIQIYRPCVEKIAETARLKTLVVGGAIDVFRFSSPEEILYFTQLFRAEEPARLLSGIAVETSDAVCFRNLMEIGLRPTSLRR